MLKLIQSSCSVVLLRESRSLFRVHFYSPSDHFEPIISQRHFVNSPKLSAVIVNTLYLRILDESMRKKSKSRKNKKKVADNVAKKTKSSSHSWIKRFFSRNKLVVPTMSCKDASCSSMTGNLQKSLMTADTNSSDDDVVILDSPDNEDLQVLFDSRRPRNDGVQFFTEVNKETRDEVQFLTENDKETRDDVQFYLKSDKETRDEVQFFVKSDKETNSWKNLSAAEIEKAAKEGKEKLCDIRTERFTKFGEEISKNGESQKHQQDGFTFRVLSWNILSQKLMEQHKYLYPHSHNISLDWEYRKNLILSEIKDSNADILTLQEVEELSFHNLKELKDLGYEGIFKRRTHDKIDGCALYYRPDTLVLKEYSFVEFFQPEVRLLDRDNVGIVARFEPKSFEGTEFIVATTHLLYNPRRHDIKLVQMQLLLAEIERLAFNGAIRQNDKMIPMYHPCILTGDLNLMPHTGVYNLITEGELEYDHLYARNLSKSDSPSSFYTLPRLLLPPYLGITNNCQHDKVVSHRKLVRQSSEEERRLMLLHNSDGEDGHSSRTEERINFTEEDLRNPNNTDVRKKYGTGVLSHNLKFKSVYTHMKRGEPEATTHQDWWMTVDYIFYSPVSRKDKESNLHLISYKGLPTAEEAEYHIKSLPNLFCGSDHLPLVSSFFLAKS